MSYYAKPLLPGWHTLTADADARPAEEPAVKAGAE